MRARTGLQEQLGARRRSRRAEAIVWSARRPIMYSSGSSCLPRGPAEMEKEGRKKEWKRAKSPQRTPSGQLTSSSFFFLLLSVSFFLFLGWKPRGWVTHLFPPPLNSKLNNRENNNSTLFSDLNVVSNNNATVHLPPPPPPHHLINETGEEKVKGECNSAWLCSRHFTWFGRNITLPESLSLS